MVVDCSVTLAWFFEGETSIYADAVRVKLTESPMVVPTIWSYEVANGLLVCERRSQISQAKCSAFLALLHSLPIIVDEYSTAASTRLGNAIARERHLSSNDAAYLELAMRLGQPLATLDPRLKEAALAVGVPVFGETLE